MAEEILKYKVEIDSSDVAEQLSSIRNQVDMAMGSLAAQQVKPTTFEKVSETFQTANIGKIEVKKETSVTLTKKMSDKAFLIAYQGKVAAASAEDGVGNHSTRWGLKEDNKISSGIVDPKSHVDADSNISYGYRVYVKLKDSGQVIAIPNCTLMSHAVTVANETATEETIEFMSTVKPLIANDGSFNKTDTALADM